LQQTAIDQENLNTITFICLNAALKGEQDDSRQFRSTTSSSKTPRLRKVYVPNKTYMYSFNPSLFSLCLTFYVPINIMPHYPSPGEK